MAKITLKKPIKVDCVVGIDPDVEKSGCAYLI